MGPNRVRRNVGKGLRWGCIGLGMLAVLLVGCTVAASPTPTPEPVEISFAFPSSLAGHYEELIEAFNEQHPSITVEGRSVGPTGRWEHLLREEEVDVFFFSNESELFYNLHEEGKILSLTPFLQESNAIDLDDFYRDALGSVSLEGDVWGIPAGVNVAVMFYNKDLFDQNNAPYPQMGWTWDDFLLAASAVSDPDQDVFGFVTYPTFAIPFIYQHGGTIFDDENGPTRTTFDDPLTIEAVEWYAGLVHDYEVMPSPAEAQKRFGNDGSAGYIFWRKKAGMYLGFLSDKGGESWGPQARWEMEWGMIPLPRDESAFTLAFVVGHAVVADTEHPQACWEFLTFLNEQTMPYVMPARRSVVESAEFEEQVGPEVAAVVRASIEDMVIVSDLPDGLEQDLEGFVETLIAILNGEVLADEGLTQLQMQSESG
jgi:multiple sugar transport system substrate-binding protein